MAHVNLTITESDFPEGGRGGGGGRDRRVRRVGLWFLRGRGSDPVDEKRRVGPDAREVVDIDREPWHWNSPSPRE